MKKIFGNAHIACALAASGLAHAQSGVSISGFLDLSAEHIQTGAGHINRMSTGQLNQSRLEFNGREDLGGGSSAIFSLMMPFSPDTGTLSSNGAFSRTAIVGLRDETWGALKLGRQQTLTDEVIASFWALRWGASTNYFLYYGNTTQLVSNAIRYESPRLGNFAAAGLYAFSEGLGKVAEVRGTYSDGKAMAALSYYVSHGHEFVENDASVRIGTAGFSYNFGPITPGVVLQDTRTHRAVANATSKYSAAVNATIPMGTHALWVDYGFLHNRDLDDANARAASVRFDYYLSRRTFIYAGLAHIWNGSRSYYQPMGASGSYPNFTSATGVSTGADPFYNGRNTSSVLVGVRTQF